jgi:hypothetical protein
MTWETRSQGWAYNRARWEAEGRTGKARKEESKDSGKVALVKVRRPGQLHLHSTPTKVRYIVAS